MPRFTRSFEGCDQRWQRCDGGVVKKHLPLCKGWTWHVLRPLAEAE